MNFAKLFEVCGIIDGAEVSNVNLRYKWFESDTQAEVHKKLYMKSPELLKALIDYLIMDEWVVNEQHLTGLMGENERYEYIKLIEFILSVKRPIKWPEIKEILEDE